MSKPPRRSRAAKSTTHNRAAATLAPAPALMARRHAPVLVPRIQVLTPSNPTEAPTAPTTPTVQEPSLDHPSVEISMSNQASRQAAPPFTRFNELSVRAIERAARYSYEVAGDSLSLTLAHVHSLSQATDPATLLHSSANLAQRFVAMHVQRSAELAELTIKSRAEFTQLLVETASGVAMTSLRIPILVTA